MSQQIKNLDDLNISTCSINADTRIEAIACELAITAGVFPLLLPPTALMLAIFSLAEPGVLSLQFYARIFIMACVV